MGSAYIMPIDQFWTFAKFLGTMNTRYLRFGNYLEAPNDDMDAVVADGDISTVSYHGVDMLKLDGLIPHYFISMGLVKTPTNPIGMWSKGRKHAPATQRGNYIINVNFSPLSELSRQLIFQNARNSLDRQKIDIRAILKGAPTSETEAKANESYEIKMKQKELEKAATYEDRYGRLSGQVVIFGEDPEQVIKDAEVMTTAIEGTQGRMVWESIGLPNALKTLQVGGYNSSDRTSIGTESRFGAMSLYAAPAIGMPVVEDLGNEEAQYVFETRDGNPFYYSSFSGGKAFRGRLREGAKSYAKDLGQRYSPVRLMCSHPSGETWARRSGGMMMPSTARLSTTSPSFMVFQKMMMAASRFMPAIR